MLIPNNSRFSTEMKRLPRLFVLLLTLRMAKVCADYEIVGDNEQMFEPCDDVDDQGTNQLTDLFDLSNLQYISADDGETVFANGYVTVKQSVPDDLPIRVEIELLHWERSQWVETIYSIRRSDFCKAALNPMELWAVAMNSVPQEYRACPPKQGMIYVLQNTTNRLFIPNPHSTGIGGKYKAVIHFKADNYSICVAMRLNVYKI